MGGWPLGFIGSFLSRLRLKFSVQSAISVAPEINNSKFAESKIGSSTIRVEEPLTWVKGRTIANSNQWLDGGIAQIKSKVPTYEKGA